MALVHTNDVHRGHRKVHNVSEAIVRWTGLREEMELLVS
jgi:hypothetical protein